MSPRIALATVALLAGCTVASSSPASGYAVLSNRARSEPPTMLEVPLDDVLSSGRLGSPQEVMEHALATCAGAL